MWKINHLASLAAIRTHNFLNKSLLPLLPDNGFSQINSKFAISILVEIVIHRATSGSTKSIFLIFGICGDKIVTNYAMSMIDLQQIQAQ